MKTIDEILEGVTARGKWRAENYKLITHDGNALIAPFIEDDDAAFAARAAANLEGLCRALELCATHLCGHAESDVAYEAAKTALAEALKD